MLKKSTKILAKVHLGSVLEAESVHTLGAVSGSVSTIKLKIHLGAGLESVPNLLPKVTLGPMLSKFGNQNRFTLLVVQLSERSFRVC